MTLAPPAPAVDLSPAEGGPGYDVLVALESVSGKLVFVASHPDLPHVFSQGDTPEEALDSLAEVREEFLADMAAAGIEVPAPRPVARIMISEVPADMTGTTSTSGGAAPDAHLEWRRVP